MRHETVYSELIKLKVIQDKHIPRSYLEASVEDRLELLQGLMDTVAPGGYAI